MPENIPTIQLTLTGRESQTSDKHQYSAPKIIHELELETRAGSPLGIPNPLDPADVDPAE